tara:strand:- start:1864 stop:2274 length:411 start_codon:yes stop_codon:yes gene_type:complete
MEKFNEHDKAKADIVNSPDVTDETAGTASEPLDSHQTETASEAVDPEAGARNGRVVAKRISKSIKDIDADEADALKDAAEFVFRKLWGFTLGRVLGSAVLVVSFGLPFLPRVIRFAKQARKTASEAVEEDKNNGNI